MLPTLLGSWNQVEDRSCHKNKSITVSGTCYDIIYNISSVLKPLMPPLWVWNWTYNSDCPFIVNIKSVEFFLSLQEAAATLVHSHLRRSSSGSGSSPPSPSVPSSVVMSSPRLQSPGNTTPQQLQPRGSLHGNSLADLDDDNLNPEEVYR